MRFSKAYILLFGLLFAAFAVVFNTFPRSTFSELEKRELAVFPEFSTEKLFDGSFTSEVSSWFSDSEPFRDRFMWLSMQVKDLIRLDTGEENITFHAAEPEEQDIMEDPEPQENKTEEDVHNCLFKNKCTVNCIVVLLPSLNFCVRIYFFDFFC